MTCLLRLSVLIDALNRKVGIGVGWLILLMTIVRALNATSRKLLNARSSTFLEIQWYLFAAVFLLAAGYTLLSNGHVRVDIVDTRLPTRRRLWDRTALRRIAEASFSNFMTGQQLPFK